MSGRSFKSLVMVASCAGAALSCYLVSLRVASERAALEEVETRIVLAQRDLRVLQTEIGTRGRLAQLERWNASVLALSAPTHNQFLKGGFELARLARPEQAVDFEAPVVLAAAPKPDAHKVGEVEESEEAAPAGRRPASLLQQASLKTETREVPAKAVGPMPLGGTAATSSDRPVTAAKPARTGSLDRPGLAAAKSSAGATGQPVAKARPDATGRELATGQ
jgi:hypothetical protein